jgi:hypothetical protein
MSNQQAQHVGRQFVSTKSRSIANWVSMHCNMISMDTSQDCTTIRVFSESIIVITSSHLKHHSVFLVALLSGGASSYVCGFILPIN